MSDETTAKHFVAYHNREKMGRSLAEGDPCAVLSNQSLQRTVGNLVWMIEGTTSEANKKLYALRSVFRVNDAGDSSDSDFKYYAKGNGALIDPSAGLNDLDWFADFFKSVAHFSIAPCELKDERFLAEFCSLAQAAGTQIP